ncbi:MAG: dephospho-CoA kinase [Candidatus Eisenbacteria bacterium]
MSAPFVLGVTGGIGAGKSTLCRLLEEAHGVPLLDADRLGHEALVPGTTVYEAILARFGEEARGPGGALKRSFLGERVFRDPAALRDLNALVHPWILERIESRLSALKASGHDGIVLLDAALLLDWLDRFRPSAVVLVVAAREVRLERLERRGVPRPEAERRMAAQVELETTQDPRIDWVIDNSGSRAELARRAAELWRSVLERQAGGSPGTKQGEADAG